MSDIGTFLRGAGSIMDLGAAHFRCDAEDLDLGSPHEDAVALRGDAERAITGVVDGASSGNRVGSVLVNYGSNIHSSAY